MLEDILAPPSAAVVGAPSTSAVSWAAVFAGGVVAAAVSLILVALGSGLGFSMVSPWPDQGVSGVTFTVTAAIWLVVTQWISAGVGGYVAGRLRKRWIDTHTHEVFFRDTAHGLLTWALATLVIAAMFASTIFASIGLGAHAASQLASGATNVPELSYFTDRLLRTSGTSSSPQNVADQGPEVGRVLAHAVASGTLSDADRAYLTTLVAARTGMGPEEAKKRVDDVMADVNAAESRAKQLADAARKAAAEASIYLALSLVVGAFIASVSAALGGRLRDQHP